MSQVENTGVYGTTEQDAWPLMQEEIAQQVIDGVTEQSATLRLFQQLPNLSTRTRRLPVLNAKGMGYFTADTTDDSLTGDTDVQFDDDTQDESGPPETEFPGRKKTHQFEWKNVYINAEPIAIIVPVPEDVVADLNYNIWDQVRPHIVEAFGEKIDEAVIWGQGRPNTWPSGIVPTAVARGYTVTRGTHTDLADDISELMGLLEEDGRRPTSHMADPSLRKDFRGLRDSQDRPLYHPSVREGDMDMLWGLPLSWVWNDSFQVATSKLITGDTNKAVYAIRQDMEFKVLDQAVITDDNDEIVFNLAQQDMVALRVVMRLGWAVPNPIHTRARDRSQSYPFAVLEEAT